MVWCFHPTNARRTAGVSFLAALVLGYYVSWLALDVAPRWLGFLGGALLCGFLLWQNETKRAVLVGALYMLAALVAVTPIVYELAWLGAGEFAGVGSITRHVLTPTDLLFVLVFLVLAAISAGAGYLAQHWERVQARF
jgi:hypothetical protein